MLPLLLIALGVGAIALYVSSDDHEKATAEAALAHQVADAHLKASAQADQEADQHAAQQQAAQQTAAKQQAAVLAAAARQKAAAHAAATHNANTVGAQKVAVAAPLARNDRERSITALQADLTEANNAKIAALELLRRAAEIAASRPDVGQALLASAQATYVVAQERVRVTEAGLRKLGVNPLEIPAPPRRDVAR